MSQIRDPSNLEGPGRRIYGPQEQGGPVITPGAEFHFLRLLRLAGLQFEALYPASTRGLGSLVIQSRGGSNRKLRPQQFFYCYRRLPKDSPDIFDVFRGHYQATHIPYRDRYIATVLQATVCLF
jgi:hypothetical protein